MARTRQTARSTIAMHTPHFTDNQQQKELFTRLVRENCLALNNNHQSCSEHSTTTLLQSKLSQYKHCTKLAQLWILEDMIKNEREKQQQIPLIVDEKLLKQLPDELKVEIVSFIPTTSKILSIGEMVHRTQVGGGEMAGIPVVEHFDTWFISMMKHRALSKSFKMAMEVLIFKTLSSTTKGLDITGFISTGFQYLERRVLFVTGLLLAHNRFMNGEWDGDFELDSLIVGQALTTETSFNVNAHEPYPTLHTDTLNAPSDESGSASLNENSETLQVVDINLDNLKTIEEDILKMNEDNNFHFTNTTPFDQSTSLTPRVVAQVDIVELQSIVINQIYNNLSYMEIPNRKYKSTTTTFKNTWIKSLSISLGDYCPLDVIFNMLPNIEDLTIIIYKSMDIYKGLQSLQLNSRPNLKSVKIISMDNFHWSYFIALIPFSITTIHVFVQDGSFSFTSDDQMDMILDGKKIPSNIMDDGPIDKQLCVPALHFQSSNFEFFKILAHKYHLFLTELPESFTGRVGKFEQIEEQRLFTDFIGKNYPLEEYSIDSIHFRAFHNNNLKEISWYQYLIYLSNAYQNGRWLKSSVPRLLYYGMDVTNSILNQQFPNTQVASILLEHLKTLKELKLCTIDITDLKSCFIRHAKSYSYNQAMIIFRFACEHLTEEEKLEFFGGFKFSTDFEFNIVHVATKLDDFFFKAMLQYIPSEALLGKTMISNHLLSSHLLLRSGGNGSNKSFFSLLHMAMESDLSNETILQLIEKEPLIVTQADNLQLTPLHWICKKTKRWPLIPHLEKIAGSKCWSVLDSEGKSPYHYAKTADNSFIDLFPYYNNQNNN